MISDKTLRLWFRNKINDDSTLDMSDFAWENRTFDGSGKELFFNERYTVTQENISTNQESVKWGILFYDVIVNKGSGTESQEESAETLADIFDPSINKDQTVADNLKIDIDEATTGARSDFDANRVMLPVRIEFRAYEYKP